MNQYTASNILRTLVKMAAYLSLAIIVCLIGYILVKGIPALGVEFSKFFAGEPSLFSYPYNSKNVSLVPAVINTLIVTGIGISLAVLFGIFTSIYLVEYSNPKSLLPQAVRITADTLSGIPSIIYGLFGSIFFVYFLGLGMSLLAGALTVSIMVLPLIIRATQEALMSVPQTFREASFALGAGKLRTIFQIVLPVAAAGILAGIILGIGRIVGETAALLYTSGTFSSIGGLASTGRTLSIHMYMLSSEGLHIQQAYATAAVLLLLVLSLNIVAAYIARRIIHGKGHEV